jgi:hypothetical protein
MYIWFPYKTPYLSEPQYNTPLPKVYNIVLSIENSRLYAGKELYNNPAPIEALSLPDNWCWMILRAGIYYPSRV